MRDVVKPLLRMMKNGKWELGVNRKAVPRGSRWIVDAASMRHGWQCWVLQGNEPMSKNSLKGEVFAPVGEPLPAQPSPIESTEYVSARTFCLRPLVGESGVVAEYKTNSISGREAFDALLGEITRQREVDPQRLDPVIELWTDAFEHKRWGKIFKPLFNVVGWTDASGKSAMN